LYPYGIRCLEPHRLYPNRTGYGRLNPEGRRRLVESTRRSYISISEAGSEMSTTPISRNTFRARIWLPAVRASGIGWKPRFHDLDRTHASWLLAGGSDLRAVMDRMGHAQIQTQEYLHPLPDTDQRNLDAFNRIAGRPTLPHPNR
jgi:integrase